MQINVENIKNILPKALWELPVNCCLVGGCVRDLLLEKMPDDYDVAVCGDLENIVNTFAAQTGQKIINLSNDRYRLFRLVGQGFKVDFVPLNGSGLAEDLGRRDFTINAMAYEPATGVFSDLHGGVSDLQAGRIVMVNETAFVNDPLRLLRAFRFAAALNFVIDDDTVSEIKRNAHLAAKPAAERILTELAKLFATPNAAGCLRQMEAMGVLYALFPEMTPMKEHRANNFTDVTALEHTFRVVECMEALLLNPQDYFTPEALALEQFKDLNDPQMWFRLKMAALLHDVGKPAAKTVGGDGRIHYYSHENFGAETAVNILKRLKCSNRDILLVSSYIGAHMKALTMFNNHRKAKRPAHKRALFYLDHNTLLPPLFCLFWADALSKKATLKEGYLDFIYDLARVYVEEFLPRSQRPLPLNGHDLRRIFNPKAIMFNFMIRELNVENIVQAEFTAEQALKSARTTFYMLKSREKQTRTNNN